MAADNSQNDSAQGWREALEAVRSSARLGLPGRPVMRSKWISIPSSVYHQVCAALDKADG